MSQREELIQTIRWAASPQLSYELGASIADAILESEWLADRDGERYDVGQDDGFTRGAHINESKTFVS